MFWLTAVVVAAGWFVRVRWLLALFALFCIWAVVYARHENASAFGEMANYAVLALTLTAIVIRLIRIGARWALARTNQSVV